MDEQKQPGLIFENVRLVNLYFEVNEHIESVENLEYNIDLGVHTSLSEDKKLLKILMDIDLFKYMENPPMTLKFSLVGIFRTGDNPNLDLESFATLQGPALLVPFAREVIANITSRSPLPALIIPPLNVLAMLKKKREIQPELKEMAEFPGEHHTTVQNTSFLPDK